MIFIKIVRNILNLLDDVNQRKIIDLLSLKLKEKAVIFDVGAHHGETIKKFNKKLSIKKIYSFEASPVNFRILLKNINKFNSSKFEIYNFALGEKLSNSFINQTIESSSSTINKLNKKSRYYFRKLKVLKIKDKDQYYKRIPIKIITLDKFIEEKKISSIDLLKIDTEGYEFKVIKGLDQNHNIIRFIYFEHHYDDMIIKDYKFNDINKLLKLYGFKMILKSKMIFRKSFEYVYENTKYKKKEY